VLSDQSKRLILFILALLLIGWLVRWQRMKAETSPGMLEDFPAVIEATAEKIDPRED
jgi:hypothetical protein